MDPCLPARADLATLEQVGRDHTQQGAADMFGFASWAAIRAEVERRGILNDRDLDTARARIADDPSWATRDLTGWCDHRHGAAPLNYMAMLRFDAPRLGLTGPLPGTGDMARLLLDAGAPVNGNTDEDETPLMTAASYGDADVARVLIEAGADVDRLAAGNSGGVPGGSALLHAAVFGMTDVLDAIAAAGATIRSHVEAAAVGDLSAWPIAEAGDEERIRALIMATDHQRVDLIRQFADAGTPIDAVDPIWHRHPLRLAAEHGRPDSTRLLLELGADPRLTDDEGRSPLDLCQGQHRYLPGRHHDEVAALLRAVDGHPT